MGKKNVVVEASGEMDALVREFRKVSNAQRRLERNFKKTGEASAKAGKQVKKGFGSEAISTFRNALVGGTGILSAFKLVSGEIRELIRLQNEAKNVQLTLNQAQSNVIRNLSGKSEAQIKQTLTGAQKIARETRVPERFIDLALANTLSASGQKISVSLAATRRAARLNPDNPEAISGVAGSFVDLRGLSSLGSVPAAAGFITTTGALSRVSKPEFQAKNIPPVILNAAAAGAKAATSAALFAAISTASADITGEQTATSTISLVSQLRAFSRGEKAFRNIGRSQRPAEGSAKDILRSIQASPELQKLFLAKASFEQKKGGVIEQLIVDPNSAIAKEFSSNLQKLDLTEAQLVTRSNQDIANLGLATGAGVARVDRLFKSTAEQFSGKDVGGAKASVTRQGLKSILTKTGLSKTGADLRLIGFELRTGFGKKGALNAARKIIADRLEEIPPDGLVPTFNFKHKPESGIGTRFGLGALGNTGFRERTVEEERDAEILQALLEGIKDELKILNGTNKNQLDESRRNSIGGTALAPMTEDR